MANFENFTKKVAETAKAAVRKSGDIVEVTKLNLNIGAEEDKIKKLYADMGRMVYELYLNGDEISSVLVDSCEKIKNHEKTIQEIRQKVLQLKNMKACQQCSSEIEMDFEYCPRCGARQEEITIPNEPESPAETQDPDEMNNNL